MEMMKCPNCDHPIKKSAVNCPNCNWLDPSFQPVHQDEKALRGELRVFWMKIGALVLFLLIAIVFTVIGIDPEANWLISQLGQLVLILPIGLIFIILWIIARYETWTERRYAKLQAAKKSQGRDRGRSAKKTDDANSALPRGSNLISRNPTPPEEE